MHVKQKGVFGVQLSEPASMFLLIQLSHVEPSKTDMELVQTLITAGTQTSSSFNRLNVISLMLWEHHPLGAMLTCQRRLGREEQLSGGKAPRGPCSFLFMLLWVVAESEFPRTRRVPESPRVWSQALMQTLWLDKRQSEGGETSSESGSSSSWPERKVISL